MFFPIRPFYWAIRDQIDYLGDVANNLSESDSEREPEREVEYHCMEGDLQWGGEMSDVEDSDDKVYVVRRRRGPTERNAEGERVIGSLTLNMDLTLGEDRDRLRI